MLESQTKPDAKTVRLARNNVEQCFVPNPRRGSLALDFIIGSPHPAEATSVEESRSRYRWGFPVMWLFIGFVSAVDAYLTIRFQSGLEFLEQNPVGVLVLSLSDWNPAQFIGLKYMGSTLVLGFLTTLHARNPRRGLTVTAAVAAFQFVLLCYLLV